MTIIFPNCVLWHLMPKWNWYYMKDVQVWQHGVIVWNAWWCLRSFVWFKSMLTAPMSDPGWNNSFCSSNVHPYRIKVPRNVRIGRRQIFFHYVCLSLHYFIFIFCGLECVGHSFAYIAHFVFLKIVRIRNQRAAVVSRFAAKLATHLPSNHSLLLTKHPSSSWSVFSNPQFRVPYTF